MNMMTMGDLDNDKHVDIVTTNDISSTFTAHLYNPTTLRYESSSAVHVDPTDDSTKIASIVVSKDIRALQSLYVIYQTGSAQSQRTFLKVFK